MSWVSKLCTIICENFLCGLLYFQRECCPPKSPRPETWWKIRKCLMKEYRALGIRVNRLCYLDVSLRRNWDLKRNWAEHKLPFLPPVSLDCEKYPAEACPCFWNMYFLLFWCLCVTQPGFGLRNPLPEDPPALREPRAGEGQLACPAPPQARQ